MTGSVHAIGVGPGDPDLITLKALKILQSADTVCAPTGADDATSYALSIVQQHLNPERQEIIRQTFPMTRGRDSLEPYWRAAAADVINRVDQGKRVVFITIGDPCLYSTFLYLHRIIKAERPDIPLEIVPGISSITAAAAAAGMPLGLADERIAILPGTAPEEEIRNAFHCFDTLVFMKISRHFDRVYPIFLQQWPDGEAAFIRRVGSSVEEVVTDPADLLGKELDYLSLLIVRRNRF